MKKICFKKKVIGELTNPVGPSAMNTFMAVGDLNNDGRPDIAVCGRNGFMAWFENKGMDSEWERHLIDEANLMECGGLIYDLTGNGYSDK